MQDIDLKWMEEALKEAETAFADGEIPVGAVIVANNRIIGRGHNMTQALNDVTAHAEMIAITAAEDFIGKYLEDCTLYVTVEPCLMCAGAIGWAQIKRIVIGTLDQKRGFSHFMKPGVTTFHPKATVTTGVKEEECRRLMTDFFASRR